MKLSKIKLNPNNPRLIKDEKFNQLVKSIKDFPKMMKLRPIIIDTSNMVLGGNMRLKALKELGYKEIPEEWIKQADELTEDEKREFIIKDNIGFGEHDWDILVSWDSDLLEEWGLDLPISMSEFVRPEFTDEQFEKVNLEMKGAKYFYIEYYDDTEAFERIKELLGDNLETTNRINPSYFLKLINNEI